MHRFVGPVDLAQPADHGEVEGGVAFQILAQGAVGAGRDDLADADGAGDLCREAGRVVRHAVGAAAVEVARVAGRVDAALVPGQGRFAVLPAPVVDGGKQVVAAVVATVVATGAAGIRGSGLRRLWDGCWSRSGVVLDG